MKPQPAIFEDHEIRRVYDEATETWLFSVIDIIQVLTQQPDYQGARKYWKVLKGRLAKEGSQLVTNCYPRSLKGQVQFKFPATVLRQFLSASMSVRAQLDSRTIVLYDVIIVLHVDSRDPSREITAAGRRTP